MRRVPGLGDRAFRVDPALPESGHTSRTKKDGVDCKKGRAMVTFLHEAHHSGQGPWRRRCPGRLDALTSTSTWTGRVI